MLFAVVVVCCLMFNVCCWMCDVFARILLHVGVSCDVLVVLVVRCVLVAVRCVWLACCCLYFVDCWLLLVVCCLFSVV